MVKMIEEIYDGFECAVIEEEELSEWFQIKNRVAQRCVMAGFLFLLTIDYMIERTVDNRNQMEVRDIIKILGFCKRAATYLYHQGQQE